MKSVLVDTQDSGTLKTEAFGHLALGELAVDARDGGCPDSFHPSHGGGWNAFMMLLEDALPKGFGASPTRQKSRKGLNEAAIALATVEAPTMNEQNAPHPKGVEMTSPAFVLALAAQSYACATRACHLRGLGWRKVDNKLLFVLA